METVNIHEAKPHLSRLVERAAQGEPFVIAKAGKALVKVMALAAPEAGRTCRTGFLAGEIKVPDDRPRLHSTLAYTSPIQFEENWLAGRPRQANA